MKKTIGTIFDEASANEIDRLVNKNAAPELPADTLRSIKEKVYAKTGIANLKKKRSFTFRLRACVAAAVCMALIIGAAIAVPMLDSHGTGSRLFQTGDPAVSRQPYPDGIFSLDYTDNIQVPSPAPRYNGNPEKGMQFAIAANPPGISVTAQLIEMLPDTYTFFDDWDQREYRLLLMKTVKLLKGQRMTDEFYYLVPVDYMTDFSVYDTFVIKDMGQGGYEYSVMYNKTQGTAERLTRVLFGYDNHFPFMMGSHFMAFDKGGNFDRGLWQSTERWSRKTEGIEDAGALAQVEYEEEHKVYNNEYYENKRVYTLQNISGEAAKVLSYITSFENGIYVPIVNSQSYSLWSTCYQDGLLYTVRYINGFATNEGVDVISKEVKGTDEDFYSFTKAHFGDDDLRALPDLASAFASVAAAYDRGEITPPDAADAKVYDHGIFGWYAKTPDGVIGVVRVNFECYGPNPDNLYYIIEYGDAECRPISSDALIERLGEYETTYISELVHIYF